MTPSEVREAANLLDLGEFLVAANKDPEHYSTNELVLVSKSRGSPEFRLSRDQARIVFDNLLGYTEDRLTELGVVKEPEDDPVLKDEGVA